MSWTHTTPVPRVQPPGPGLATPRRAWARCGVLGGLAGAVGLIASVAVAPASEDLLQDNADLVASLDGKAVWVWLFQAAMSAAALGLTVFGVGLRRRLDEQEPVGSLAANLAMVGLLLAAGLCLVGGGISTQLFWALQDTGKVDPDSIAANLELYATLGWVWAGVGLSAGVIAWAGLAHESVGRKTAWFSAVIAGLITLLQLVPLQYLAAVPAALWCLVAGVVFARE